VLNRLVLSFAFGLALFGFAIFLASVGGGHGPYGPMKVLFPWLALSRRMIPTEYEIVATLCLALLQFPAYAALLSNRSLRRPGHVALAIACLHAVGVASVFALGL